jgi:hypothetical protein
MANDYGFPVALGNHVSAILGTDSHDPAIVSKLVQRRRDEIQECISISAMELWPEELGIRPEGIAISSTRNPESA